MLGEGEVIEPGVVDGEEGKEFVTFLCGIRAPVTNADDDDEDGGITAMDDLPPCRAVVSCCCTVVTGVALINFC